MSLEYKGGINWEIINDFIQQRNSLKLFLFLSLGCKPLKDVIMYHPDWTVHQGTRTLVEFEDRANEALDNPAVYIEAIPKRMPLVEVYENFDRMCLHDTLWKDKYSTWWEEIEHQYANAAIP